MTGRARRAPWAGFVAAFALLAACDGRIERPDDPSAPSDPIAGGGAGSPTGGGAGQSPGQPNSPDRPGVDGCAEAAAPLDIPTRAYRLNVAQYRATVAELFGGEVPSELEGVSWPFEGEDNLSAQDFTTLSNGPRVVSSSFDRAIEAAERIAALKVERLRSEEGHCLAEEEVAPGCIASVLDEVEGVLFRRPEGASAVDVDAFLDVAGPSEGAMVAEELLFSALMSPRFLFRMELETPRLAPHELAEKLSFALTDRPPDGTLLELAATGALSEPAVLAQQVERLLFTEAGLEKATKFIREYVRYDKLFTVDPRAELEGAPRFRPSELVEDTDAFVGHLIESSGRQGFLRDLFSSEVVFAQRDTRDYYGEGRELERAPEQVTGYAGYRQGILTQPSWLISFSQGHRNDPIERGRFIREQLLCDDIPEIAISDVEPLPEDDEIPLSARLKTHTAGEDCYGCHQLMDDLGLALEQYDHFGRYRTDDAGQPLRTGGRIVGAGDAEGPFADTQAFLSRLASSRQVSTCFAGHAFAFYVGQKLTPEQSCLEVQAERAFQDAGQSLPALLTFIFSNSLERSN